VITREAGSSTHCRMDCRLCGGGGLQGGKVRTSYACSGRAPSEYEESRRQTDSALSLSVAPFDRRSLRNCWVFMSDAVVGRSLHG
jgi:hypothetical protein